MTHPEPASPVIAEERRRIARAMLALSAEYIARAKDTTGTDSYEASGAAKALIDFVAELI